jgi:hypothetical protein
MKKLLTCLSVVIFYSICSTGQVGIGTTTPNSMLDVRGSLSTKFLSFAGNITAASTDNTLVYTGIAAATVTLPSALTCQGRGYWIKNGSTTLPTPVLTIAAVAAQTIDGITSWVLDEGNEMVHIISNGTNWYVLTQDVPVAKTGTAGGSWLQGGNRLSSTKSIGTIANFDLPFITNNAEKMRLTTGGFLGLGTAAPAARLHIVTQGSEAGDDYLFDDYGAGTTQGIYITKSK